MKREKNRTQSKNDVGDGRPSRFTKVYDKKKIKRIFLK